MFEQWNCASFNFSNFPTGNAYTLKVLHLKKNDRKIKSKHLIFNFGIGTIFRNVAVYIYILANKKNNLNK